jgi:hypothetical protein
LILGGAIGFYDGFFGPGTGSFLIFLFVRFFGFDFLHASAASKVVNVATNIAALGFFIPHGHFLPLLALLMAGCNVLGSLLGTHLAMRHGSGFRQEGVFVRGQRLYYQVCARYLRLDLSHNSLRPHNGRLLPSRARRRHHTEQSCWGDHEKSNINEPGLSLFWRRHLPPASMPTSTSA